MKDFFIFLCLVLIICTVSVANSCRFECLAPTKMLIDCSLKPTFRPPCKKAEMVKIDNYKQLLIDLHNEKRNIIAGGGAFNLPPACHMATMQWDDDLAILASLQVQECIEDHSGCTQTAKYNILGQNLAMFWTTKPYSSSGLSPHGVPENLRNAIEGWYAEGNMWSASAIDSIPGIKGSGHFGVMMAENNTRVGCAAATFIKFMDSKDRSYISIACSYARCVMKKKKLYQKCYSAATSCTTKNRKYKNLCSPEEKYDVNIY